MVDDRFRYIEEMAANGHEDAAASELIALCKEVDLRDESLRPYVDRVACWISSANESLRRAVVFALCHARPVPGYEHVALEGWRRIPASSPTDAHWYATALVTVYNSVHKLDYGLVDSLVEVLLRPAPVPTEHCSELDYEGALADSDLWKGQAMRVLRHLHALLQGHSQVAVESNEASAASVPNHLVDWRQIAEVYYSLGKRRKG